LDASRGGNPAAPPPGNAAATVWAVPDCVKVNPITGNVLEEKDSAYEGDSAGAYIQSNPAWSGKSKTVSLNSLRGEWIAYQVVCQNNGKETVSYKLKPGALAGPGDAKIPESAIKLSRLWYQKAGKSDRGWYADPMLPLNAGVAFEVPDAKNAVPNQKNQTVYAEFFVPKDAKPGPYTGTLELTAGTAEPLVLNVVLNVSNGVIPDKEHFIWSMNAYSSPGAPYGDIGSEPYVAAERSFYMLGHEHRTCLAALHYGHGGRHSDGAALPLTGKGNWQEHQCTGREGEARYRKGARREGESSGREGEGCAICKGEGSTREREGRSAPEGAGQEACLPPDPVRRGPAAQLAAQGPLRCRPSWTG